MGFLHATKFFVIFMSYFLIREIIFVNIVTSIKKAHEVVKF